MKANESNEKKDPTDNKLNIIRAPGHYEQKDAFILYKFDDLQSRTANLKSEENLKKKFKFDSVTIKKQSPTYLLPEFGCYRKLMTHKSNKSCIKLIKPFGIVKLLYLGRKKKILSSIERTPLTPKNKILK